MIDCSSCLWYIGLDTPDRICDKILDWEGSYLSSIYPFFEVIPAAFHFAVTKQCEMQTVTVVVFCSVGFVGFAVYPTALK